MVDYIAWWDQYMSWIRTATTMAFFGLLLLAVFAYFLGSKKVTVGSLLTCIFLFLIATYAYTTFGLELFLPEVYQFFDGLFNGEFL